MKRQARHVVNVLHNDIHDTIPFFLCPALARPYVRPLPSFRRQIRSTRPLSSPSSTACQRVEIRSLTASTLQGEQAVSEPLVLPLSCPGCGAPTQTLHPNEAGFYTTTRKTLVNHVTPAKREEDNVLQSTLKKIGKRKAQRLGVDVMKGMALAFRPT
jgi:hypothetical protein